MGPIALFDKSFLQALNIDESVWLNHYFMCIIGDSLVQIGEEKMKRLWLKRYSVKGLNGYKRFLRIVKYNAR